MIRRFAFALMYMVGQTRWDTGITPPEIVGLLEDGLPCGRALDLGCGTGTTAVYLAEHGWEVVGIDFVARPITIARRKARKAGVAERTCFIVGDVANLAALNPGSDFDLAVDIGCLHSLPPEAQMRYAHNLGAVTRLGAVYMLDALRPTPERSIGLEIEQAEALFAPSFRLVWSSAGSDAAAGAGSAWFHFERMV